jgi:uncharacterized protein (TIGR02118 family)
MPGAKLIVMYPPPKDVAEFERVYFDEHIPMVAPVLQAEGATKVVLSKVVGAPAGSPAYHRVAELHFPSMEKLQAFAGSRGGQDGIAHAEQISTGGPLTVVITEEDVVTF